MREVDQVGEEVVLQEVELVLLETKRLQPGQRVFLDVLLK